MMAQEMKNPNEPLLFDDKELSVSEEQKNKNKKPFDYEDLMERRLAKKANKRKNNEVKRL